MLTKVIALGAMAFLIGCGVKSADNQTASADPQKSSITDTMAAQAATLPAGTQIRVRLAQTVDTQRSRAGDGFIATLDDPLVAGDRTLVPKGTEFRGHVISAGSSGRLKGRAVLGVTLDSFEMKGKRYRIETTSETRASAGHKKRNGILIGGGAGLGAALGAAAGGGKGALIGAGAGGAAGTAGAVATGKENVAFPAETALRFSLKGPVRI
jgi:hypothetical protein